VHDLGFYELRGMPTVMVASDEFVHAAHRQAEALGMPELAERAVYVPHPIQDATDDEMREKARSALEAVLRALVA
jgi:hypothetical protein